ncbi:hypothetical protein HYU07_05575 [Candidatus Woesearchaeota archaeon]|nr:hypothetical protein [Candidatus Woesearchaeota archaeon]
MKNPQVVKIGASSIIKNGKADQAILKHIAYDVNKLSEEGTHSILVVSGAIKLGMHILGYEKQPANDDILALQRCACVGQKELMKEYDKAFDGYATISQLLVTFHNLEYLKEEKNIENRIKDDVMHGIITLINYNDGIDSRGIVLYDKKKPVIRDNDLLAAQVAKYANASRLVILTNSDGKGTMGNRETKEDAVKSAEAEGIEVIVGECAKGLYNLVTGKERPNYRTCRNV